MTIKHPDTILAFQHDGKLWEVDHLGISAPEMYGTFAVYVDGVMVSDFCSHAPWVNPRDIPFPSDEELKEMAVASND